MKKPMLRLTLLALVTVFVFSSCKKDKDDKLSVTTENLIGNYKVTEITLKSTATNNVAVSMMSEFPDCSKDDIIQLKSGGVLVVVDQGEKCDNDETTTWELNGNQIELLTGMLIPGTYDVVTLSKSQLVVSITEKDGDIATTYTIYLNRQ